MTTTTQPRRAALTGIPFDLSGIRADAYAAWPTRAQAAAALARVREDGLNRDGCVEFHPAATRFCSRFWVIGRPDPASEFTWLMNDDGTWTRGRLEERYDKPPRWLHQPTPEPIPASVTHDYRYSAGSVPVREDRLNPYGWDGRPLPERYAWTARAWCVVPTCPWSTSGDDEATVRAGARWHRANPGGAW